MVYRLNLFLIEYPKFRNYLVMIKYPLFFSVSTEALVISSVVRAPGASLVLIFGHFGARHRAPTSLEIFWMTAESSVLMK